MVKILNEGGIFELLKPVVNYINGILATFVPNGENYLVLLIAFVIAYGINSKNNWNNFTLIIFTIIFYTSFRFFGIGG